MNLKLSEIKEVTGKKLTTPQTNLLLKLENEYDISISTMNWQPRMNRFSGAASAPVHPLVGALIDFVYDCDTGFSGVTHRGKKVQVSIFDRVRFMVLALDSAAYYAVLD